MSGGTACATDPADGTVSRDMNLSDGSLSDGCKAAAAAGDLLQLAAAASNVAISSGAAAANGMTGASCRSRGGAAARSRDTKPYQRRGARGRGGRGGEAAGRGGADKDCWLPGGFWWQDDKSTMPPGRQPGELAGWTPLAGEHTQKLLQEQKKALSQKEQLVQGLGSRDDAAAYLQQLNHAPAPSSGADTEMRSITRTVDDSVIEHSTAWKQLASWGGFRRHFKGEDAPAGGTASLGAPGSASAPPEWREHVQERLQANRAEVQAAKRRLDDLLQAQAQLERLLLPDN